MNYLKCAILFFVTTIVMYLAGSFISASFDITQWAQEWRVVVIFCTFLLTAFFISADQNLI